MWKIHLLIVGCSCTATSSLLSPTSCGAGVYGQEAVTFRFLSDHRSHKLSSGFITWMGDHLETPRALGNTWCTRHMAKPRPQVGRVCQSHHQNTPQSNATKCDWSLVLSKKKNHYLYWVVCHQVNTFLLIWCLVCSEFDLPGLLPGCTTSLPVRSPSFQLGRSWDGVIRKT